MKYQEVIHYEQTAETLLRYFTDPDFYVRKYREQGATNVRVEAAARSATESSVTVTRDVPVEVDLPPFARGLVPSTITLVQTDRWDLARRQSHLEIIFKGMPVRLTCTTTLSDTPTGAREDLVFEIRVNVPLIGGKLEELLARDLQLKFCKDTEATHAIIAEQEQQRALA